MTICVEACPRWPEVVRVLRRFWAGEIDGLELVHWRGSIPNSDACSELCAMAVDLVKKRRSWPWKRLESALWRFAEAGGWDPNTLGSPPGEKDSGGKTFSFERLGHEEACP